MISLLALLCALSATSTAHVLIAVDEGGTITYYTVPVAVGRPQFGVQPHPPPFGVQPRRGFGPTPPPIEPDAEEVTPVNTGSGRGGPGHPGFVPVAPRAHPGAVPRAVPGAAPGGYPTVVYHQPQAPPHQVIVYTHHPGLMPNFIHLQMVLPPQPRPYKPRRQKPKEKEGKPKVGPKEVPEEVEDKRGVTPPPPPAHSDKDRFDPDVGRLLKTAPVDKMMERIEEDKKYDKEVKVTTAHHDDDADKMMERIEEDKDDKEVEVTTAHHDDDADNDGQHGLDSPSEKLRDKDGEGDNEDEHNPN